MRVQCFFKWLVVLVLSTGLGTGAASAQTLGEVFEMIGGMDTVSKLSSTLLKSAASDPRLSGLLGKMNTSTASPKLADQMCAMLGGGCKAPLTDQQVTAGAKKLNPSQSKALSENFNSALNAVSSNPLVKDAVIKAIGPKLGGIVGALI
jgi:truncated hemoglobin YjbI